MYFFDLENKWIVKNNCLFSLAFEAGDVVVAATKPQKKIIALQVCLFLLATANQILCCITLSQKLFLSLFAFSQHTTD